MYITYYPITLFPYFYYGVTRILNWTGTILESSSIFSWNINARSVSAPAAGGAVTAPLIAFALNSAKVVVSV
jgi:hypothetical protein